VTLCIDTCGLKKPKRFKSDLTHQSTATNVYRRRESAMESQQSGAFWDSNHSDKKLQGIDEGIASQRLSKNGGFLRDMGPFSSPLLAPFSFQGSIG